MKYSTHVQTIKEQWGFPTLLDDSEKDSVLFSQLEGYSINNGFWKITERIHNRVDLYLVTPTKLHKSKAHWELKLTKWQLKDKKCIYSIM